MKMKWLNTFNYSSLRASRSEAWQSPSSEIATSPFGLLAMTVLLSVLLLGSTPSIQAEGNHAPQDVEERIARLKALRSENPEAFRAEVQQMKAQFKERLQKLREENPQKFKELIQRRREQIREKLKHLKGENPEKFHEFMEKRRAKLGRRAEWLKANPPQFKGRVRGGPQPAAPKPAMMPRPDRRSDPSRRPKLGGTPPPSGDRPGIGQRPRPPAGIGEPQPVKPGGARPGGGPPAKASMEGARHQNVGGPPAKASMEGGGRPAPGRRR